MSMNPATVDVVVAGGGMAGVMAALAAAERGCQVWIVDPSNVLGGQGTAGGVAGFCGDTQRVNHLFDELVARLLQHQLIAPACALHDRRDYDLEWCAFFLQEMLVERQVTPLLHSRIVAADFAQRRVTQLTLSTAGELRQIRPRFVIDATGRCLLPRLAGLPTEHLGALQQLPMSLYFTLWDTGRPVTPILPPGCPAWSNDEEIPMTSLHRFDTGKVEVKMKVVGFDADDGLSLSAAEVFARRQMMALIYYLQTHGYRGVLLDRHVLASVSRQIGVREERRLVGEYVLTEADVAHNCVFPDAVAVGTYHFDYHWPDRMQRAGTGRTTMVEPYHIPLRSLQPGAADNLLVAGRGISADQMAMSNLRVMATVAQLGFAAGVAAAQCVKQQTTPSQLDVSALQQELIAGGQQLDLGMYGAYLRQLLVNEETVASTTAAMSDLKLARSTQGQFVARWRERAAVEWWIRRRGQWQAASSEDRAALASEEAAPEMSPAVIRTEDGLIRLQPVDADWLLQVSTDDGQSWSGTLRLHTGGVQVTPSMVQTPRGVAVLYADGQAVRFWHGSFQHIQASESS